MDNSFILMVIKSNLSGFILPAAGNDKKNRQSFSMPCLTGLFAGAKDWSWLFEVLLTFSGDFSRSSACEDGHLPDKSLPLLDQIQAVPGEQIFNGFRRVHESPVRAAPLAKPYIFEPESSPGPPGVAGIDQAVELARPFG